MKARRIRLGVTTTPLSHISPVPGIIDPVFAKTSQNARFLLSENERFGLVFVKTGSINSGTGLLAAEAGLRKKNQGQIRLHFMIYVCISWSTYQNEVFKIFEKQVMLA